MSVAYFFEHKKMMQINVRSNSLFSIHYFIVLQTKHNSSVHASHDVKP